MIKLALIETKPTNLDYYGLLGGDLEFDTFALCSDKSIKKVLKKDCDIDINTDEYDFIILVGSDATKYFTSVTRVTDYSGKLVDEKFIPIINPGMLKYKPEAEKVWLSSVDSLKSILIGEGDTFTITKDMYVGIQNEEEIEAFLEETLSSESDYFAVDCETTGLYPRDGHILGISISYEDNRGAYLDMDFFTEKSEELFKELFQVKTPVFHNSKFDIAFFEYTFNFRITKFEDTMLLHYLANEMPGTHGLKQLALRHTPYGDYEKEKDEWTAQFCKTHKIKKKDFNFSFIPFDIMTPYAALDAVVTRALYQKMVKIKDNTHLKKVYDTILVPGTRFLIDIQDNGVPFSPEKLEKAKLAISQDIDRAVEALNGNAALIEYESDNGPFNPNSVPQLRKLLFDYCELKPTGITTKKGKISTNAKSLKILAEESEVPKLILDIRKKVKLKNTYIDKIIPQLDKDNRLRTNFNLHSTTSGRLSSSGKLNMQQLPRDDASIKGAIKANDGHKIVAMDLKTAEIYVAAVLSKDKALQNIFKSANDFHGSIAKRVFGLSCPLEDIASMYPTERHAAKSISFGILYGAKAYRISEEVTESSGSFFSKEEAQEVINSYFRQFPQLHKWIKDNTQFIIKNGYIYSHFGRKRRLYNVTSSDKSVKNHEVRSGLNFLVQSAASDINLLGAIDTQNWINSTGRRARIFGLVHDSILAEVPNNEIELYCQKVVEFIQRDRGLTIPGYPVVCDLEIGDDYSMGKFEKQYESSNL